MEFATVQCSKMHANGRTAEKEQGKTPPGDPESKGLIA